MSTKCLILLDLIFKCLKIRCLRLNLVEQNGLVDCPASICICGRIRCRLKVLRMTVERIADAVKAGGNRKALFAIRETEHSLRLRIEICEFAYKRIQPLAGYEGKWPSPAGTGWWDRQE